MAAAPPPAAPLTRAELCALVDVAAAAAHRAGALMLSHTGRRVAVAATKAGIQDLVTEVDKQCQDVIEAHIKAAFPHADFLGEESVPPGAAAADAAIRAAQGSRLLFVVDPIDGTTNFVCDLAISVVSIAVASGGEVVGGVVHNPYRGETFTAVKGGGAWLNGARLAVSPAAALGDATLAYGLHHRPEVARCMLRGLTAVTGACRGARSLGSAALHLAYVAAGRLEGFWELGLSAWDIAAGALLVAEAGGRVTDTRGAAYALTTRDVMATCGAPGVHDALLAALRDAGADSIREDA